MRRPHTLKIRLSDEELAALTAAAPEGARLLAPFVRAQALRMSEQDAWVEQLRGVAWPKH